MLQAKRIVEIAEEILGQRAFEEGEELVDHIEVLRRNLYSGYQATIELVEDLCKLITRGEA